MSTSCRDQGLETRVAARGKRALPTEEMWNLCTPGESRFVCKSFCRGSDATLEEKPELLSRRGKTEPRPWRALPAPSWITHKPSHPHTCSLHVSPVPRSPSPPPNPGPGSRDAPSPAYHNPFCKHSKETSPHLLPSSHLLRLLQPPRRLSRLARLLLPGNLRD